MKKLSPHRNIFHRFIASHHRWLVAYKKSPCLIFICRKTNSNLNSHHTAVMQRYTKKNQFTWVLCHAMLNYQATSSTSFTWESSEKTRWKRQRDFISCRKGYWCVLATLQSRCWGIMKKKKSKKLNNSR